ncbi:MAG: 6-carboxytetrahydropterin synthase [Sandaracinaceae bacterium]|nr:6-carboxytetrahydropterin synthase [Sandaracinaceae bacterium]
MFRITKGIHVHFAHHVRGHRGACISLHGHTWKLEVTVASETLDAEGFVVDFAVIGREVLAPSHRLLDHALAIGEATWRETHAELAALGTRLVDSRHETMGSRGELQPHLEGTLGGARNELPGDIKIAVFPFAPTSETLARWLYEVAVEKLASERIAIVNARVYEALHPVETYAEYSLDRARL